MTQEALLAGSAVVVLLPGFPISGRITGPDSQPVASAKVTVVQWQADESNACQDKS